LAIISTYLLMTKQWVVMIQQLKSLPGRSPHKVAAVVAIIYL